MTIVAIALISGFIGVALSSYAQKVESKAADVNSIDEWSRFVRSMSGGRK